MSSIIPRGVGKRNMIHPHQVAVSGIAWQRGLLGRAFACGSFAALLLATTPTRNTSKALNVSCHLIHASRIHGQMYLPDSMHSCLNVDEIVRLVAHELAAPGGNAYLVALACCCKSFEDPALDALWAKQKRLLPLLQSFPGDVWNEGGCTVSVPTAYLFSFLFLNDFVQKSFKRLPTTTEWGRFRKYARRIRKLNESGIFPALSSEVFSVLQSHTIDDPFLPNLNALSLSNIVGSFIPFISLFLSPRITSIRLTFAGSNYSKATIAAMVASLPTLNLRAIIIHLLPRNPMITAAVSQMLLATNRNILQQFHVDSPLTKEASDMIYRLPNLRNLSVIIEGESSLPSASLPNLTNLTIEYDNEGGLPQLFHGATFGKLESVTFFHRSKQIGNFLQAFERAALSSSVQNMLSKFCLSTSCSWNPNYSSLLPFTQLEHLAIEFSCDGGCSSRVDDDIVISLSRTMPKLQALKLGDEPCGEPMTGVTVKGLVALALHCPDLQHLCIHFQVASLSALPTSPEIIRNAVLTGSWTDCPLSRLVVGKIAVPEESVLTVALNLLHIFPRIENFVSLDEGWGKVKDAIRVSRQIVYGSGEHDPFTKP